MITSLEHIDLTTFNTFGLKATATRGIFVESEEEVKKVLTEGWIEDKQKLYVWGGGSNILLTGDIEGIVLMVRIKGIAVVNQTDTHVYVEVGAGEVWHDFVKYCIDKDWGGIENLSLIPGCVGASPIQNIGAYGVEIKDVFHSLKAVDIATGETHTFSKQACAFGYRESVFKHSAKGKYLITSVTFCLTLQHQLQTSYGDIQKELSKMGKDTFTIADVSEAVCNIRRSKLPDPQSIGNAGSFFKNPSIPQTQFEQLQTRFPDMPSYPQPHQMVKIPAGWLIEQAGWKGKTFGKYGVHVRQALVLVNYGGASGKDIYQLSSDIQASVFGNFGINLEREVNVL